MTIRDRIAAAAKLADPEADAARLSTLRLILAAIRDRDQALRDAGQEAGIGDDEMRAILERMAAQRRENAEELEEAARLEQAQARLAEARLIEEFLPRRMSDAEMDKAIAVAVEESGASSLRDLGRVMAVLKVRHAGQMDLVEAGRRVKARLS